MSNKRALLQLDSKSVKEFFESEVPMKEGRPLWHLAARPAINMRQLLETDTIEFRHFPGTSDCEELRVAAEWCRDYLDAALNTEEGAVDMFHRLYKKRKFPVFPPYIHWMDIRFRMTCHDGSLTREEIEKNIARILKEDEKKTI